MKEFRDLFASFITESFNLCLNKEELPEILKFTPIESKRIRLRKKTTDQLVFYVTSQKSMRKLCIKKMNDFL